jgi:hypothetical protein
VAQLAAAFDEGLVGGDEVFGELSGVAAGGVEAEVAEQGRGDVQREAGADELGGEQAPEVVRGEPDGFAVIGAVGPVGGGVEQVADGGEGRYSWSAAVSRSGSVLGPTARVQRLGGYATDEVALAPEPFGGRHHWSGSSRSIWSKSLSALGALEERSAVAAKLSCCRIADDRRPGKFFK